MNRIISMRNALLCSLLIGCAGVLSGCGGGDGNTSYDSYADTKNFNANVLENSSVILDLTTGVLIQSSTDDGNGTDDGIDDGNGGVPDTTDEADTGGAIDTGGDSATLGYEITSIPSNGSVSLAGSLLTYTPNADFIGTDYVTLTWGTIEDLEYLVIKVKYTIKEVDTPPVIEIGNIVTDLFSSTSYAFKPTATDEDGDTLLFSIENKPDWAIFDSSTGTISGTTPSNPAVYPNVIISVTDGKNSDSLNPFTFIVTYVNSAPKISGFPETLIGINAEYDFTPTALDTDGDELTFIIQNKPDWITFDVNTGRIYGVSKGFDGVYPNINISVNDGTEFSSLPPFTITVEDTNHAPTISGFPATRLSLEESYDFTPLTNDVDGDVLTFSIQNKPSWITFNTSTGAMSGTSPNFENTYSNIIISVTDGTEFSSLPSFSITIDETNHTPTIEGIPTIQAYVNETYSFTPITSDIDGDALTFYIASKPPWATFNSSTGELSGTLPNVAGAAYSDISIYVDDGKARAYLPIFAITVNTLF